MPGASFKEIRGTFIQSDPVAAPGGGSGPEARTRRVGVRERLQMIRKPAIVPDHDLAITRPEYEPGEFAEKVILITGVSHFRGFGYETAKQLVEMGAKAVAFNYRTETEEVRAVVADLQERATQTSTQIVALQADISQVDQAASLVGRVVERTGRLDVYVDNAGRIAMGTLWDQTPEDVYTDLMTNVIGPQIILGEAVKQMVAQGGGRVVSILSIGADGAPNQTRYAGSKAFKFAAARSGAMESVLTRSGITFVSVAPGFSPTTMTREIEERARPTFMAMVGQENELPPEAVAEYIVFAASSLVPEELNGQVIPVYKPMTSPQANT